MRLHRHLFAPTFAGLVAGALLTGCPDREVTEVVPVPDNVLDKTVPVNLNRELDILFVVDNSGSMAAEQAKLTENFDDFIDVLRQIEGGLPNVHIGVVSSNVGTLGAPIDGCSGTGDNGQLLVGRDAETTSRSTCATTYGLDGTFISDVAQADNSREINYDNPDQLPQLFTCMATLGVDGCGFEMHLESAYRAIKSSAEGTANSGFYRDDAYLAIIFLADEDDCSTENAGMFGDRNGDNDSPLGYLSSFRCHEFGVVCDNDDDPREFGLKMGCRPQEDSAYQYSVQRYVDYFLDLKADPGLVIVAGILGAFDSETGEVNVDQDPDTRAVSGQPAVQRSCGGTSDPNAGASPPVRLASFLNSFPNRNTITSICDENFTDALTQIGELLKAAIGNRCIDEPLSDRNPNLDGVQEECTVVDVTNPNTEDRTESVIPKCEDPDAPVAPCWFLEENQERCPNAPDNLELQVFRGGASVPSGTVMQMQCVTDEA